VRPAFEIADAVRRWGDALLTERGDRVTTQQRRVLRAIVRCRTAELGGHVERCDRCTHQRIAYNSCRNRHCPKCQAAARAEWTERREAELLSVPYFHVVFTLPHQLNRLALANQRVVYGLLFRAAWATLREIATDPKHLGANIGALMVLHTWGQNLSLHPHVHCVVPGGGLSADGERWVACRRSKRGKRFFLPVRVLSRVFRGKFLAMLRRAYDRGELQLGGALASLEDADAFDRLVGGTASRDWVVYAKRPFGGPRQVLRYLARYTHRVAISNHRLQRIDEAGVTFGYRDYADSCTRKQMTLGGVEFLRRFLMHTLPKGFTRIRHFGLLAPRNKAASLRRCRELLGGPEPSESTTGEAASSGPIDVNDDPACPQCAEGRLLRFDLPSPQRVRAPRGQARRAKPTPIDSS